MVRRVNRVNSRSTDQIPRNYTPLSPFINQSYSKMTRKKGRTDIVIRKELTGEIASKALKASIVQEKIAKHRRVILEPLMFNLLNALLGRP